MDQSIRFPSRIEILNSRFVYKMLRQYLAHYSKREEERLTPGKGQIFPSGRQTSLKRRIFD